MSYQKQGKILVLFVLIHVYIYIYIYIYIFTVYTYVYQSCLLQEVGKPKNWSSITIRSIRHIQFAIMTCEAGT